MPTLERRLYRFLLRLHPAAFRDEFAREMALDFEDALDTYGLGRLLLDATGSLARQWSARVLSGAPDPVSAPRPSLLAGNYVMIRDKRFSPLELGLGAIAAAMQVGLCLLAVSASARHRLDLPVAYASSSAPPGQSNGPAGSSASALAGVEQTAPPKPELLLFHPNGPLPSYEVAIVKPLDPEAAGSVVKLPPGVTLSPLSIRRYIMNAYGAIYAAQIAGGPDWLNKDAYAINGKMSEDLASALQKMAREDRTGQTRMLQQSLLADRFHLVAHFETRVLPVYELLPARGGLKIAGVPAPPETKSGDPPTAPPHPGEPMSPGNAMTRFNGEGLRVLNARAIKMQVLARIIGPDMGDRPIVDHTGFTGYFDIADLTWAPIGDANSSSQPDAPSLAGALEEKLGLRLVPAKAPIEVLVIDRIERPTPN